VLVSRRTVLLAAGLVAGLAAGCGDDESPRSTAAKPRATPTATAAPAAVAAPQLGRPAAVPGTANVFGAGRSQPPAPAGGGPGTAPPAWRLPDGRRRVVTFPAVNGLVCPIANIAPDNGAAGDHEGPTNVQSNSGIAGIVHRRNGMFLVGVFLTDAPPAGAAPPRLDFTRRESFAALAPRLGQTFLVGDGKGRRFHVPARATRLFLGFADGYLYQGPPGWYGNNTGELTVTVAAKRG
jgi:hypothetical protein